MQLLNITKVVEGEDAYNAYMVSSLPCPDCKQVLTVKLPAQRLFYYNQGASISEVFPESEMSDDDRERFITGLCGPCWDKLFPDEDERDE
jgi:L-lactate utilization protein LutB